MKVLVTGGAGFIGSHVVDALLATGHQVVVVDDLSSGRRANVPDGALFVEADVRDEAAMRGIFARERPEAVSHQAAQTSVARSVDAARHDAEVNVLGTLSVLGAAVAAGVRRFVYAGTGGAVYGEVPAGVQAVPDDPPCPKSPYGCSKLAGEHYVRAFADDFESTTILRYANVYGPRQDPHGEAGVVAIFAARLLANAPLRLFARRRRGDEGCVRDYVYVGDVVRANLLALAGDLRRPVIHVATGVDTSTATLLRRMAAALGVDPTVEHAPPRPGDLERSVLAPAPDLPAPTPLDRGLRLTLGWYRRPPSRPASPGT